MEQDVVDFLWSRFGTAVHNMFEDNVEADNLITEERLFQDIEGWNISGAIDLQEVDADGSIGVKDYKVTSVW
jgi:RecB family exonuclease